MIRFACPGCNATYTVDDSKGGKAGKCPKCSAQFVIPTAAEGGVSDPPPAPEPRRAPPPPPPPPADNGAVEIKPCPKCGARLSVAASDLGVDVECPYCQAVYTAKRAGGPEPSRPSRRPADEERPRSRREEDDDRPSRRRRDEDEEEDRPSRRRQAVADDDEDDRPSRRSRRDEEEDEDDRPRRRKRRRRSYEPHRGTTIILCAVFGLCCGFLAIAAIIMGFQDLGKMNREEMDPDGKTTTIIGLVLGCIVLCLNILGAVIRIAARG